MKRRAKFTKAEAKAKIGQRVRVKRIGLSVPKGTVGTVLPTDQDGLAFIAWRIGDGVQCCWFDKAVYEQFVVEL